jgi:hypothetical protein
VCQALGTQVMLTAPGACYRSGVAGPWQCQCIARAAPGVTLTMTVGLQHAAGAPHAVHACPWAALGEHMPLGNLLLHSLQHPTALVLLTTAT